MAQDIFQNLAHFKQAYFFVTCRQMIGTTDFISQPWYPQLGLLKNR